MAERNDKQSRNRQTLPLAAAWFLDFVARLNLAEIKSVIVLFGIERIIIAGQKRRIDRILVHDAALEMNPGDLDDRRYDLSAGCGLQPTLLKLVNVPA